MYAIRSYYELANVVAPEIVEPAWLNVTVPSPALKVPLLVQLPDKMMFEPENPVSVPVFERLPFTVNVLPFVNSRMPPGSIIRLLHTASLLMVTFTPLFMAVITSYSIHYTKLYEVTFNQAGSTISGATTFANLSIYAGSNVSSVIAVSSDITIGNLLLANGLLQINGGTTTITNLNPATSPAHVIPESAGIEVNTGATLYTGNFTINNKGLIHIAGGTANFGTQSGNSIDTNVDGAFVMESGTVNIAGRLHNSAGNSSDFLGTNYKVGVTISGGTLNLATVGNSSNDTGSLDIDSSGYFDFSGGTINFINSSTATRDIDLRIDTPGA